MFVGVGFLFFFGFSPGYPVASSAVGGDRWNSRSARGGHGWRLGEFQWSARAAGSDHCNSSGQPAGVVSGVLVLSMVSPPPPPTHRRWPLELQWSARGGSLVASWEFQWPATATGGDHWNSSGQLVGNLGWRLGNPSGQPPTPEVTTGIPAVSSRGGVSGGALGNSSGQPPPPEAAKNQKSISKHLLSLKFTKPKKSRRWILDKPQRFKHIQLIWPATVSNNHHRMTESALGVLKLRWVPTGILIRSITRSVGVRKEWPDFKALFGLQNR